MRGNPNIANYASKGGLVSVKRKRALIAAETSEQRKQRLALWRVKRNRTLLRRLLLELNAVERKQILAVAMESA